MEIKNKILDYEKRLLQMRQELNELMCDSNNLQDAIIQDKILFFQNEISHLNNQLLILQQDIYKERSNVTQIKTINNQIESLPLQNSPNKDDSSKNLVQKFVSFINAENYSIKQDTIESLNTTKRIFQQKNNKNIDIENIFGKTGMAIFASILIFISLIMFTMVIAPLLNDIIKIILMFAVSFGITSIGYIYENKHPTNKFFDALLGCGLSCIYISLFISHIYFNIINEVILYLTLSLWAVFTTYISKIKTKTFYIIGNIGITISLFFGAIKIIVESEMILSYGLILFFIVAYSIFMYSQRKLSLKDNFISFISIIIDILIIFFMGCILNNSFVISTSIITTIVHLAIILKPYEKELTKKYILTFILFTSLIFIESFMLVLINSIISKILIVLINIYMLYKLTKFEFVNDNIKNRNIRIIHLSSFIITSFCCIDDTFFAQTILLLLLFVFAYLSKEKIYQIVSSIGTLLYILSISKYSFSAELLTIISIFVMIVGCYWVIKENYSQKSKAFLILAFYSAIIKSIYIGFDSIINNAILFPIAFTSVVIIHFMMYNNYSTINWDTGESEKHMILFNNIINELLFFISMLYITSPFTSILETIAQIIIIATSIALIIFNNQLILNENNKKMEIYIGLKYTIAIINILSSFKISNIIISICCALLAFWIITYGFKINKKHLRIYGLIIANISILKLGLIDISYNSTLQRALSLFICGIICFSISYLYNRINQNN